MQKLELRREGKKQKQNNKNHNKTKNKEFSRNKLIFYL